MVQGELSSMKDVASGCKTENVANREFFGFSPAPVVFAWFLHLGTVQIFSNDQFLHAM